MSSHRKVPASRRPQVSKGNDRTTKTPPDAPPRQRKKSSAVGRDASGKFVKGFSGNPHGSKIVVPEEVRELARTYSAEGILRLVHWMRSADPQASLTATKLLLDRGLGKSIQPLIGAGGQSLVSITMQSGAIVSLEDAQRAYQEICADLNADISVLQFAAPRPTQAAACPDVEPLPARPTEAQGRVRLWETLGK